MRIAVHSLTPDRWPDLKAVFQAKGCPVARMCPLAWDYQRLAHSPIMRPVDAQPVWSIVCFVVPSEHRGQGVATALLQGAAAHARRCGATLVETYPVDKPGR